MNEEGLPHLLRKKEDMETNLYTRFDLPIMYVVSILCLDWED